MNPSGRTHIHSGPATLALLLPGYSPNLSWMARALNADLVLLDDLHPFSRKSRIHRTKIRTPNGHQWLTIPILKEDRHEPIHRVRIERDRPWLKHHLQALEYNYRNSIYFDFYEPEIRADLETAADCHYLIDAVRHLMERQWAYLQLPDFPLWMSECTNHNSAAGRSKNKTDPAVKQIEPERRYHHLGRITGLNRIGNFIIWQEADSRNYQKPHAGTVQPVFHLPEYRQHFQGFNPDCGVLDLLFEYGPDAWQVLDQLIPASN